MNVAKTKDFVRKEIADLDLVIASLEMKKLRYKEILELIGD